MTMDSEYPQDEKTILLDREGFGPAQGPVTDFPTPPRFEQLEDRMIYTAHLQGAQSFKMGSNSLLAAAWELLSQVALLKASPGRESLQTLNDQLSSGVTAFEAHALHLGVENSQVISARYVLCSVIDEAVVTTPWGSSSDWSKRSLLSRFHNETFGGESFSNCWSVCPAIPSSIWPCWNSCTCACRWASKANIASWSGERRNLKRFTTLCTARSGMCAGTVCRSPFRQRRGEHPGHGYALPPAQGSPSACWSVCW